MRIQVGIPGSHQKENAALAVRLAEAFIKTKDSSLWASKSVSTPNLPKLVVEGLEAARWPGRCQIVPDGKKDDVTWYLDGAHTEESLQCCLEWFVSPEAGLKDNLDGVRQVEKGLRQKCPDRLFTSVLVSVCWSSTVRREEMQRHS